MSLQCKQAATLLERYSLLLALAGENTYRASAIAQAAKQLANVDIPLHQALADGTVDSLAGIGEGIRALLTDLDRTGMLAHLAELEQKVPRGVEQLTELRGIGAAKARKLWQEHGICSIDELETACREHILSSRKGFTVRSEAALLEAVTFWRSQQGKIHRHTAWQIITELRPVLENAGALNILPSGELRRGCEVISTLTLVLIVDEGKSLYLPAEFEPLSDSSYRLQHERNINIELFVATPQNAGTILVQSTGSKEFVAALTQQTALPLAATEEELFSLLGLPFIPPELRDDPAIVQQARMGMLPSLVATGDLRGMIHVHTTASDGHHSLEEMVLAARELGFEYIVICDHSQSAAYAGGLTPERVAQQRREIDQLNARLSGITILHGIESDILPDGSLDYSDDILAQFDLVVASVHSHFSLSKYEQTQRILHALRNPYTTILGHPTGRLLLRRNGYEIDLDAIIAEAARTGTVIEFNVNPHRYDLDWRYHSTATAQGVLFAIDPDAHSIEGLHHVYDGVSVARHGQLSPERVINTFSLSTLKEFVSTLRQRKHRLAGA